MAIDVNRLFGAADGQSARWLYAIESVSGFVNFDETAEPIECTPPLTPSFICYGSDVAGIVRVDNAAILLGDVRNPAEQVICKLGYAVCRRCCCAVRIGDRLLPSQRVECHLEINISLRIYQMRLTASTQFIQLHTGNDILGGSQLDRLGDGHGHVVVV